MTKSLTSTEEANKEALHLLQQLLDWDTPDRHGKYIDNSDPDLWRISFSTEKSAQTACRVLEEAGCKVQYAAPLKYGVTSPGEALQAQLRRSVSLEEPWKDQSKQIAEATAKLRPAMLQELERAVLNRSDQYRRFGASAEECRMLAENVRGTLMDPPLDLRQQPSLAAKHDPALREPAAPRR